MQYIFEVKAIFEPPGATHSRWRNHETENLQNGQHLDSLGPRSSRLSLYELAQRNHLRIETRSSRRLIQLAESSSIH